MTDSAIQNSAIAIRDNAIADCAHSRKDLCARGPVATELERTDRAHNFKTKTENVRTEISTCAHSLSENKIKRVVFRTTEKFLSEVKLYASKRGFTLTEFFELCAQDFIARRPLSAQRILPCAPFDDLMIDIEGFKTASSIIKRYLSVNFFFNERTKWRPADDRIAERYNTTDIRKIEVGLIITAINKKQSGDPTSKINSFRYYTEEINRECLVDLDEEALVARVYSARRAFLRTFGEAFPIEGIT
jgi:hypothetical protein